MNHRTTKAWAASMFAGITLGMIGLFTPTAQGAPADDCQRTAKRDRALCALVKTQPAYVWGIGDGGLSGAPNGHTIVHEITHQGLTRSEMHSYLTGERANYVFYTTGIKPYLRSIIDACGNNRGSLTISFTDADGKPGGNTAPNVDWRCP